MTLSTLLRSLTVTASVLLAPTFADAQSADTYPSRPVRIIAGSSAGGTADLTARILADQLTKKLGGTFIVEDQPGASGAIAALSVARTFPDGYTLLLALSGSHAILPAIKADLKYDPVKDFAPISVIAFAPSLLMVNPSLGVKSLQELIALLKKNPGKLNYGSGGIGGTQHLSAELLLLKTGTQAVHVPYSGSGRLMPAIVAGEVQFAFDTMTTSLPQARSGTVIPLAVSSKERAKSAPDIAPVGETIPGFDVMAWNGLVAPPGTPRPIIDKLNKALVEIMASPDIVAKFEQLGTIPASSSPDEFAKFIADEVKKFKEVAEAANIKAE